MVRVERSLWIGAGVWLLCASAAVAQDGNVIGPPQLRDFQLQPQERIVTQPAPPQPAPVQVTPPSPVTTTPSRQAAPPASTNPPAPAATAARPRPTQPSPTVPSPAPASARAAPIGAPPPRDAAPPIQAPPADASPPPTSIPAPTSPTDESGSSIWLFALPLALLALFGIVAMRRRRGIVEDPVEAPVPGAVAPPPKPRTEPVARPWVELELRTERATFNAAEANVQFELEIRNTGKSPARNLRIDVKMFNAGAEQDKEIGAFFRTAGRETARLKLPGIAAGASGTIRGEVGIKREEMKAVMLDDRMLFIPVVAVNALYECGDGRTGQSSKSYVVGRELQTPSEKMGAFRVDQGPRIWRTVGQRPHKLARRV